MFRPDAIQIAAAHARRVRKARLEKERRERAQAADDAKRRAARKGNADE